MLLDGQDVTRLTAQQRVRAGLVRTFQINMLFPSLTPLDAVVLAMCQRDGLARISLRRIHECKAQIDEAGDLLERFGLLAACRTSTQELSYGEQRLLEVVLAFAMRPRVLLLDEPAAGLSTGQGGALFEQLSQLAGDATVLFIEHDMHLVFRFADRVSVLAARRGCGEERRLEMRSPLNAWFAARARWSVWEIAFWALWVALFFVPQANLLLLSQVLVWGLFALSLNLLLGYRGIPSLGHAAFFGIGAYTAGFLGKYGWSEPLTGLLLSASEPTSSAPAAAARTSSHRAHYF